MGNKEMPQKAWRAEMGAKFLEWRQKNLYSGGISVPEVAHFAQDVVEETKQVLKETGD